MRARRVQFRPAEMPRVGDVASRHFCVLALQSRDRPSRESLLDEGHAREAKNQTIGNAAPSY